MINLFVVLYTNLPMVNAPIANAIKIINFSQSGIENVSDAHFFTELTEGSIWFSNCSIRCSCSLINCDILTVPAEGIDKKEFMSSLAISLSGEILNRTWWFAFIGE